MSKVSDALGMLAALGLPKAQQNERSALCLLALLELKETGQWADARAPLMGITPIMDFVRRNYQKDYAPNTRETFRRQTMHQFVEAGLALYNPDDPGRAVNSPKAVYQIEPEALQLIKTYGTSAWFSALPSYLAARQTLLDRYAHAREMVRVPIRLSGGSSLQLSSGPQSQLVKAVIEEFAPRFAPGSQLVHAGDTENKLAYFDSNLLAELGVKIDTHGKLPDVVIYFGTKDWLLLIEAVARHGPIDGKRRDELTRTFSGAQAGLVFVTAFPDRATFSRYASDIAWETEVWVADNPSHLIHFNGSRFLGPYEK
jgi:hypothetical protein